MNAKAIAAVVVCAAVALVAVVPRAAEATYGLDLSSACYDDCFSCLKSNGYSFAVPRVYQSTGQPDPTGPHTIYNAWAGGMSHVDGYMFPCPTCGNPQGQMADCINNLRSFQCKFGMLWLDIEGPQYWMSDPNSNIAFIEGLFQQAQAMGVTLGIYTSYSQWSPIFGGYTGGSGYPLWYAHYDGNPSFSDFSPFNGWSSPAIKQYNGDVTVCGLDLDQDWYPGSASGAPNYTEWAIRWPKAFNVTHPLADLNRPVVDPATLKPKHHMEHDNH